MKISYKTDYCLKIILDLAKNYHPLRLVHLTELSSRQDIPRKFLEQLLLMLKKGGFIQSKKGPKGGYSLTRDPAQIRLGEVIRFVEGSFYPISCIDPAVEQGCDFEPKCVFAGIWKTVEKAVSGIVDPIDFADLVKKETRLLENVVIDFQI
ncbi:MAG: Rrf2 family transcriptional regulator [Proteobacteria bacterium]|nr:Rrf2 family transcriptional regulator [Pseudomonadota bacterium]